MGRLRWLQDHRTGNPGCLFQSDKYFYIRDTGIYFRSSADGQLDIVTDNILAITASPSGSSALNSVGITTTDSTTMSSGYGHGLHIGLTKSGTTSGGASVTQVNGIGCDYTISGGGATGYYGLYTYMMKSGSPDLSAAALFGANLEVTEMGATDYIGGLWINKYNTTKGTAIDAFILMSNQSTGVTKTGLYFQGTRPDNFISMASAAAADMLVDGTPTGTTKKYLKVDLGGVAYSIIVNSVA